MMKKEQYQNVILSLDDGTTHIFTGKAFHFKNSPKRTIKEISFTIPKELPVGHMFEPLSSEKKGGAEE